MFTNELKKGDKVRLADSGWIAIIEDNMKGNTRLATVYGFETEMGSVYSHDMKYVYKGGKGKTIEEARATCPLEKLEHTPAQLALRQRVKDMGF